MSYEFQRNRQDSFHSIDGTFSNQNRYNFQKMKLFVIILSGILTWNCSQAKEQPPKPRQIPSLAETKVPPPMNEEETPVFVPDPIPSDAPEPAPTPRQKEKLHAPKEEPSSSMESRPAHNEPTQTQTSQTPSKIVVHEPSPTEAVKEHPTIIEQTPKTKLQSLTQEWSEILSTSVSTGGKVNYRSLSTKKQTLQNLLKSFGEVDIKKITDRNDQLAYWINLYNLATVVKILEHYPIKSIMDVNQGKVWDVKWVPVKNQKLSLNQIEHEIIRPEFKEPKIHFAVNCGAKSCPKLSNQAFFGETLQPRLKELTTEFLTLKSQNQISPKQLKISKIFEWFAEDFSPLIPFLNQHQSIKIEKNAKISYLEYDWTLNE